MMRKLDEIIYYPSTRRTMITELKTALELYAAREMNSDQLYYLIEHYMRNYGDLLFEDDYKLHHQIGKSLGKRKMKILEVIVHEISKKV